MKKTAIMVVGLFCGSWLMGANYVVDASHSSVEFSVKHLSVSNVKGSFGDFSGSFELDGKVIKALQGEAKVASINTNSDGRDKHLNQSDFFDVKKFPKATLSLIKHDGDKLEANVTMKGITKKVDFKVSLNGPIKHPKTGKDIVALSLEGKLNRKDFDIGADTKNAMISDNVDIKIELEAAEQ